MTTSSRQQFVQYPALVVCVFVLGCGEDASKPVDHGLQEAALDASSSTNDTAVDARAPNQAARDAALDASSSTTDAARDARTPDQADRDATSGSVGGSASDFTASVADKASCAAFADHLLSVCPAQAPEVDTRGNYFHECARSAQLEVALGCAREVATWIRCLTAHPSPCGDSDPCSPERDDRSVCTSRFTQQTSCVRVPTFDDACATDQGRPFGIRCLAGVPAQCAPAPTGTMGLCCQSFAADPETYFSDVNPSAAK